MVLYAEASRITLVYTRADTAAFGYVIHLEGIQVDPALVALYEAQNAAGRSRLPALRNGEALGSGHGGVEGRLGAEDVGSIDQHPHLW